MRMSTTARAVWLAGFSIFSFLGVLAILAWDERGRLDRDMLLVAGFFFSAPILCLSGLLLAGAYMARRGRRWLYAAGEVYQRPVAGQCFHCRHNIAAEDMHCPGCGRSLSGRWVSPRMMSPNAKERQHSETERIRWELRMRRHPMAIEAARSLVTLSPIQHVQLTDATEQCLTDSLLVQSLYRSAARRLHPDHNNGEHLEKWFELQNAVRTLQAFHELAAPA